MTRWSFPQDSRTWPSDRIAAFYHILSYIYLWISAMQIRRPLSLRTIKFGILSAFFREAVGLRAESRTDEMSQIQIGPVNCAATI